MGVRPAEIHYEVAVHHEVAEPPVSVGMAWHGMP